MLTVIEAGNGGWPYPLNGDIHPCFLSTSSAAALRSAVETPGFKSSLVVARTSALMRPASRIICSSAGLLRCIWRAQLISATFLMQPTDHLSLDLSIASHQFQLICRDRDNKRSTVRSAYNKPRF